MMASVAKWRDDLGGVTSTSGTSTAYVATTNQSFASLAALSGKRISVQVHTASGTAPTLAVDGLAAKAILRSGSTAVGTGDMQPATPYDVLYNVGTDKYYVLNTLAGTTTFATGTAIPFYQTAAPTGWTKAVINDKALRVTSGSGGVTGGTTAFSTVFASRTITQGNLPSYNLSLTALTFGGSAALGVNTGSATFTAANGVNTLSYPSASYSSTVGGTVASGGSGTAMDFAVQYADVIICTKD